MLNFSDRLTTFIHAQGNFYSLCIKWTVLLRSVINFGCNKESRCDIINNRLYVARVNAMKPENARRIIHHTVRKFRSRFLERSIIAERGKSDNEWHWIICVFANSTFCHRNVIAVWRGRRYFINFRFDFNAQSHYCELMKIYRVVVTTRKISRRPAAGSWPFRDDFYNTRWYRNIIIF